MMHCPFSLKQYGTISFRQYSLIDQLLMRNRWMKTRYLDIQEHIVLNREVMCVEIKKEIFRIYYIHNLFIRSFLFVCLCIPIFHSS